MTGKKRTFSVFLVLFLVAACHGPFLEDLPSEPDYWAIDARGTPLYVYLDEDYNPLEQGGPDAGKTAVFVSENPQAEGVLILAEQTPEHDDAVYIVNPNTGIIISVFFHKDQRFPWLISIDSNGESAETRLFGYDWSHERFSLEFEENDTSIAVEDIPLNRNALLSYQFAPSLTREQNIRLRNTYAALAVYENISRTFPNNGKIFLNVDNVEGVLASAFMDKSLAAFAIAVKPARQMIPAAEHASDEGPAYFTVYSLPEMLSLARPVVDDPPQLSVAITTGGVPVGAETIYYIEKGEEIIFDFKFTNFTQSTNVNAAFYEPTMKQYINGNDPGSNKNFYSFTQADGSPIGRFSEKYSIKIKRNWRTGTGYDDGIAALAIFFGQNAVVNESSSGINFWEPDASGPVLTKSIFIIQLTVVPDVAKLY